MALIFTLAAVAFFVVFMSNAGRIFGPEVRHQGDADLPFETGMRPLQETGPGMSALYWRFAVLFVVFDVDLVFLLPWALNRASLDSTPLAAVTVFVGLLLFMLGYFWRKGALSCR